MSELAIHADGRSIEIDLPGHQYLSLEVTDDGRLIAAVCEGPDERGSYYRDWTGEREIRFTGEQTVEALMALESWLEGLY